MRNKNKGPQLGVVGNAVQSKIGKLIGHDLSPAIFNSKKMKDADLQYLVSDSKIIVDINPWLKGKVDYLPKGRILVFHFKDGELTKDEICDFFNEHCKLCPFKISPDELKNIGTRLYYSKEDEHKDMKRHRYLGYEINPSMDPDGPIVRKNDGADKEDSDSDGELDVKVQEEFGKMRGSEKDLSDADVSVSVQQKEGVGKYFKRNVQRYGDLVDGSEYLFVFAHKGDIDENRVAKIANDLNGKVGGELGDDFSSDDVLKVGTKRGKFPGTGSIEDYEVFAIGI